jgi:hypothetical protein
LFAEIDLDQVLLAAIERTEAYGGGNVGSSIVFNNDLQFAA